MKICLLGATGNTGERLCSMAVARGHEVTAYVRNADKLRAALPKVTEKLTIVEGDLSDITPLVDVMKGHDVVINAAGNAQNEETYQPLVARVIEAATRALPPGGRFWLFGGAAVLDVPGETFAMLDFPQLPSMFQAHARNLDLVSNTQLDWSMLCPGPMIPAQNGQPHQGLRLSVNTWPVERPGYTRWLPKQSLLLAFMRKMPEMTITYEDAAQVILDNLETDGKFSKVRVGIALPPGRKLKKKNILKTD